MGEADPPTVAGVFGENCSICGKRNHDGLFVHADEKRIADIKAEIEGIRSLNERINKKD